MRVYTYSEARKHFAEILDLARNEEVFVKRRGGETYAIVLRRTSTSPFDITGLKTEATTKDILESIRESREH